MYQTLPNLEVLKWILGLKYLTVLKPESVFFVCLFWGGRLAYFKYFPRKIQGFFKLKIMEYEKDKKEKVQF